MLNILFFIFLLFQAGVVMSASLEDQTVTLPNGSTVVTTSTSIQPSPQEVRNLTKLELEHIDNLLKQGPAFVRNYFPETKEPNLKDYDKAFRAWQTSQNPKYTAQQVVELIGSFLGNECVKKLDMEWIQVTDQYGTDFAVRGKKVKSRHFLTPSLQNGLKISNMISSIASSIRLSRC